MRHIEPIAARKYQGEDVAMTLAHSSKKVRETVTRLSSDLDAGHGRGRADPARP